MGLTSLLRPPEDRRLRMAFGGVSGFGGAVVATRVADGSLLVLLLAAVVCTLVFSAALSAAYRLLR